MKILFLYTELAQYALSAMHLLAGRKEVEAVLVVHWKVNAEAPFAFDGEDLVQRRLREEFDRESMCRMVEGFGPSGIFISGWVDRDYNSIARKWRSKIPVTVFIDNWWRGSMKQRLASVLSRFYIQRMFSHAWVAGSHQREFALRLGFDESKIATGCYCADNDVFSSKFHSDLRQKDPKRLLYVGRYIPQKGLFDLWTAFAEVSDEFPDWELHCIGTGDFWEKRHIHRRIIHHGFVQPSDLTEYFAAASAFVMPSLYEPWGVVLHEVCLSGLPVVVSSNVGAAERFLQNGVNGVLVEDGNWVAALSEIMSRNDSELTLMSAESIARGQSYTKLDWANTALNIIRGSQSESRTS